MSAMWRFEVNALDECNLAQHIFLVVDLVATAIDDGNRQSSASILLAFPRPLEWQAGSLRYFKEHHDGHGEEPVDLPCDLCEASAGVGFACQLDSKEQVGCSVCLFHLATGKQIAFATEIIVGELEKQMDLSPLVKESLFPIKLPLRGSIEVFQKRFGRTAQIGCLLAAIPHGLQQAKRGSTQIARGKISEFLLYPGFQFGHRENPPLIGKHLPDGLRRTRVFTKKVTHRFERSRRP